MRPISELTVKKRDAVRLRLQGVSLAQIKSATGLSVPTIIRAVEAFKTAGWQGVTSSTRGRKPSVAQNASQERAALLNRLQSCSQRLGCFVSTTDLLDAYASDGAKVSKKTLLRRLEKALPDQGVKEGFERIDRFMATETGQSHLVRALSGVNRPATDYKRLIVGVYQIDGGFVFYSQDRRGERRFYCPEPSPYAYLHESALVMALTALVKGASSERPFWVMVKTDTLSRYALLKHWQEQNQDRCRLIAQGALTSMNGTFS